MKNWQLKEIPDLSGKIALVTGGNTGLGFNSCLELSRKGAHVVMASRSKERGIAAIKAIKKEIGKDAKLELLELNLADLNSISESAFHFKKHFSQLDILMLNAGVVNQKVRGETEQGLETQIGVNHFGHFALTGYVMEMLSHSEDARVITLSSGAYKQAQIDFSDINWEKRDYNRVKSYGDSKLANLLFSLKLQQFIDRKRLKIKAVSAHPGLSASPRQQSIGIGGNLSKWLAAPLKRGCRSQLLAATAPFVKSGEFWGPKYGIDGPPRLVKIKHKQYTQEIADRLWHLSEQVTHVKI